MQQRKFQKEMSVVDCLFVEEISLSRALFLEGLRFPPMTCSNTEPGERFFDTAASSSSEFLDDDDSELTAPREGGGSSCW